MRCRGCNNRKKPESMIVCTHAHSYMYVCKYGTYVNMGLCVCVCVKICTVGRYIGTCICHVYRYVDYKPMVEAGIEGPLLMKSNRSMRVTSAVTMVVSEQAPSAPYVFCEVMISAKWCVSKIVAKLPKVQSIPMFLWPLPM